MILNYGAGNFLLQSCIGYTGQNLYIKNINAALSTIVPNSSETIDTLSNIAIAPNQVIGLQAVLISSAAAGCNWKVLQTNDLSTQPVCISAGGTCGAAPSGYVTIAAAATTVTVATTKVTANSQITITEDQSLGTALSVTCNTGTIRTYYVTTRTAGTNFVITTSAMPVTNPACLSYSIIN